MAILSLIVSGYLGIRQVALDQRQLTIMEKQDEILNRRSDLVVTLDKSNQLNPGTWGIVVTNRGRAAARDFSFEIRTPASRVLGYGGSGLGDTRCDEVAEIGKMFTLFGTWSNVPVFPTRSVEIGNVGFVNVDDGPIEVEWQLLTEDGVFPLPADDTRKRPEGTFGVVRLPAQEGARPTDGFPKYCS